MNEKDIFKSEQLERVNNEMFTSFNPEDGVLIGGGATKTITDMVTFSSGGQMDYVLDYELDFPALETDLT